ncbi:adenylate/guanylate cyclase domain-containing protein [Mesorhizobium sp. WSM4884]|uniref:adenylate/guanylate cyclase domain-containing protein n=1 Tax=Mesorhizobium sp. WSM4884 TaxID=3038542 RepID=UPI002416F5AD|nr:adenylate/guanylate cyclase domain-containing protein [Mesorhizobium sp. WSM4884]MDG4885372.1 adenylate/guanylate cyclase domain-containing protein [Mesorhizobium sp. WSM4884]
MEAGGIERKLAAILAADVAGYSRLMGADEEGTLARLNGHRREHLDPCIARHRGRIVKTTGDGLLAEFVSVVDAVRRAVEVQIGMAERNAATSNDDRLEFRIGINVGDIIEQDGDVFGDGVNIASRLESIAEPGGICVSARVQEDAAGKIDLRFEDIGEQALKNIVRPIRAYRVRPGGAEQLGPSAATERLPDRPALAVLPFQNMSGDPEQDYFADGIVEDIITALSRFRSFAVIARNSSFVYKGKAIDVRQVARELGVRYVVEGSVRRSGERLRITAQLIETTGGGHLWADRFDGAVADVFDVQDRITESVIGVIEPQIRRAEIERSRRKRPGSLDAYDLYLRALSKTHSSRPEDNAQAFALMMEAVALEPHYAPFLTGACLALEFRVAMGWPALTDNDRAACRDLVRRALADPQGDATVLAQCGLTLVTLREYDRGMQIVANALEANPNSQFVLMTAGIAEFHCGSLQDSLAHSQRAIVMSPGDPTAPWAITNIALVHMALGNYAEALKFAERSMAVNAELDPSYWTLIAANAQLGRMDEARRYLAKFQALAPDVTIASIRAGLPEYDPSRMAAILEGLRLAGLKEF